MKQNKKQAVYDLIGACKRLSEYRGIPFEASRYDVNVNSLADMVYKQQDIETLLEMPIKPATEKQKRYMSRLMTGQQKELFADKVLNVYQASEAIRILLTEDELFEKDATLEDFDMKFYELATIAELCKNKPKRKTIKK